MHNYRYIDLSQTITPDIPFWPGDQSFKFCNVPESSGRKSLLMPQGCGTHIDSPMHFDREGADISSILINKLIGPACIIDIRKKVTTNADYAINFNDIAEWEEQFGKIQKNSIFIANTGWSKYWSNTEQYLNQDDRRVKHFPGFAPDAIEYLIHREILGIGIDTLSTDPGNSNDFPVHNLILSYGGFQIENLCNLDKLPSIGATVIAIPIKIKGAEEAPARVIACMQEN